MSEYIIPEDEYFHPIFVPRGTEKCIVVTLLSETELGFVMTNTRLLAGDVPSLAHLREGGEESNSLERGKLPNWGVKIWAPLLLGAKEFTLSTFNMSSDLDEDIKHKIIESVTQFNKIILPPDEKIKVISLLKKEGEDVTLSLNFHPCWEYFFRAIEATSLVSLPNLKKIIACNDHTFYELYPSLNNFLPAILERDYDRRESSLVECSSPPNFSIILRVLILSHDLGCLSVFALTKSIILEFIQNTPLSTSEKIFSECGNLSYEFPE